MNLYNTLTRKVEEFVPLRAASGKPMHVGMYTCGPTVYYYPHIGNWRTFVFYDILRRALEYNGFEVEQVMNLTDVGHLTGDNVGNADLGEDRMEKAARREGKTAWDIADFYITDFKQSLQKLNIEVPQHLVRATDHIPEQIELIKRLEDKGLAYKTETGVYFDVGRFPEYGKLGGQKLVDKRTASREELVEDTTKHHPTDFALWKFSKPEDKRQMEWDSPWGRGFPGWHLECSAMSMKYLGESFDVHTGGVDHIAIHHSNEIAQSEGATGKPFVRYWLHGEFLTVDGGRMGKSLGNAFTLSEVMEKGFDPLALRYLYFTAHYRTVLNFSWEALENAQRSLGKLRQRLQDHLLQMAPRSPELEREFSEAINSDLNLPQALAVVWKTENAQDLLKFDRILGLNLGHQENSVTKIPDSVKILLEEREELRKKKRFTEADEVRKKMEAEGYTIEDASEGPRVRKI